MTKFIITKGVSEYRATIPSCVRPSDTVLEIGFAWGTTTKILSHYCKKVVGIDKGKSFFTAVKTYPELEFHQIDGFSISQVLALPYSFNKVYIDISGCRDLFTTIKILKMYESALNPELIVIKASKLKRFVSQCEVLLS
ncbi:MAG: hypothetical protein QY314_02955 [Candidatus Dojkabacteria bacterium]|nr:MAG: hypothetical protein QY314_02955 [Candidatus Dojkabacteria bacterium]